MGNDRRKRGEEEAPTMIEAYSGERSTGLAVRPPSIPARTIDAIYMRRRTGERVDEGNEKEQQEDDKRRNERKK